MIGFSDRLKRLIDKWSVLPLTHKFGISGGLIAVAAVLLSGILTTSFMTDLVLARRGAVVVAIAQHILSPLVQDLGTTRALSGEAHEKLDAIMSDEVFAAEFPFLDLWLADGTILYSNVPGLTVSAITPSREIERAFAGTIVTKFTDMNSEDRQQHHLDTDYIEVYFPVRDRDTGNIAVVAQLREATTSLESDLASLTLASWITSVVIATIMIVTLFGIVLEGSRKIERQGRVLSKRLAQSHARAAHHRELKAEAQRASRSVTQMTDKHLRTIGTDLHDGPAQSIAFAVLRLDQIRRRSTAADRNAVVAEVEDTLGTALSEIRSIAMALVLPEIEGLNLPQVIDRAITQHVRRTGTVIAVDSAVEPVHVASEVGVCVFRFIQEGLNNAFRHGLPDGQRLSAAMHAGVLKLSITNNNVTHERPGDADHLGIGLYGLRARVQSIGGNFTFVQGDGETRLEMWLRNV